MFGLISFEGWLHLERLLTYKHLAFYQHKKNMRILPPPPFFDKLCCSISKQLFQLQTKTDVYSFRKLVECQVFLIDASWHKIQLQKDGECHEKIYILGGFQDRYLSSKLPLLWNKSYTFSQKQIKHPVSSWETFLSFDFVHLIIFRSNFIKQNGLLCFSSLTFLLGKKWKKSLRSLFLDHVLP